MLKAQCKNMGKNKNILKVIMFKNIKKKLKENFDAETVNLRINKCINAKLLKFNIFLY